MATKIYCPHCAWIPGPHNRWFCRPGCGTNWNTFETRARCPGCRKQWRVTQCLACGVISPHEDWYHEEDGPEAWQTAGEREDELVEVGAGQALGRRTVPAVLSGSEVNLLRGRIAAIT